MLGGLALSNLSYAIDWVKDRPGTKYLVSGNHDGCHPMHRRWMKVLEHYQEAFQLVTPLASARLEGEKVLLSHFPYADEPGAEGSRSLDVRYPEWRPANCGKWLLHGHTHAADQRLHGKQIHVGLDAWDLTPVSKDVVSKLIRGAQHE